MTDDQISPAEEHRRDDLATAARELKGEVAELRLSVEQLDDRTKRAERATRTGMWVSGLLLVVVALLGWVAAQQYQTAVRLDGLVQRSLCPVYGLVVGGYDPTTRAAGPDRDKYEANFAVMRRAYDELRCSPTSLVPPRTGS